MIERLSPRTLTRCRMAVNLLTSYGFLAEQQRVEGHKFFGALKRRCVGCPEYLDYDARPDQRYCTAACKVRTWRKANGVNGHHRKGER